MDFLSQIKEIVGEQNVLTDEKMDVHTSFRVGGTAKYFVTPENTEAIIGLINLCKSVNMPYYIIGNGSNLLVSDNGYEGMIISIGKKISNIIIEDTIIKAGAGALLATIGRKAAEESLTGMEFAAGIPGSLGGACVMNAGAYGGQMKDVLIDVTAITPEGVLKTFNNDELKLGYRSSLFLDSDYVVVEARMQLEKGSYDQIISDMAELAFRRRDKQPLEYCSAGSTFKRPEGYFAGKLIEDSGLKGKGFGDACVSDKHAGFVINKGSATACDVYNTICMVIDEVKKQQGIELEPEVRLLGKF